MVNRFHLGACWCGAFLAFATLVFAQSDLDNIETYTRNISQKSTYISETLDDLYTLETSIPGYINAVGRGVGDILDVTSQISNILSNLRFDSFYQLRVTDTGILQKVTSIDSKLDSKFDSLIESVNNLTNFLSKSDLQPFLYTNSPAMSSLGAFFPWDYDDGTLVYYYSILTGTTWDYAWNHIDEVQLFWSIYADLGPTAAYASSVFSWLSPSLLEFSEESRNYYSDWFYELASFVLSGDHVYLAGQAHYDLYGTHDVTIAATNIDVKLSYIMNALTNSLDNAYISSSTSPSGVSHGFSQGAVSLVGDLVSSSYSSHLVSTNVSSVNINDIQNVPNSGYGNQLTLIERSKDDVSQIQQVSDILQNNFSSFEDILENAPESESYTFDFGTMSFFNVNKQVSFTFNKASQSWYSFVRWFLRVLRFICIISTVGLIYSYVTHEAVK